MRGLIVGKTYDRASARIESVIKDYEIFWKIKPKRIARSKLQFSVLFENNDVWDIMSENTEVKGRKCNIIMFDETISEERQWEIEHCLIDRPYSGICYY